MATRSHNANGHRRRQLRARVLAEETHCALCGGGVDKTLRGVPGKHGGACRGQGCPGCSPHPMAPVIDEDIPRARGGSPYDRDNCHLMHRACNGWKSTMTLTEARRKLAGGHAPAAQRTVATLVDW